MLIKIKRIFKEAFVSFWRNRWLSLTATLIMAIALFSVAVSLTVSLSANKTVKDLKDRVDVVINFKDEASDALIQQMKTDLLARQNIKSVIYISKADALKEFKSRSSVKQEVREIVSPEDNPLPRGLQVQAVDLQEFGDYVQKLIANPTYAPFIDSSSFDSNKELIQKIDRTSTFIERFGLGLSLFFVLVAAVVVFNTIKLAVTFHSKEIEVMRLVGASDSFVRVPFLIEGFLYGIIAVIVSSGLLFAAMSITQKVAQGTAYQSYVSKMVPVFYSEFWFIVLVQVIVGAVIGVGASWLSIRKNVRI